MPFNLNSIADKAEQLAKQAKQKVEQAKAESTEEGGPSSLLGKTVKAVQAADDKLLEVQKKVNQVAGDKLNQVTGNDQAAQKVSDFNQKVDETAKKAKEHLKKGANQAAEVTADKITEVTGRETSAREVKTAAAITGVVLGAAYMADAALEGAVEGVSGMEGMDAGGDLASGGAEAAGGGGEIEGFDDSFEGETNKFFADKGGLNIKTHVIDGDGVILDSGD